MSSTKTAFFRRQKNPPVYIEDFKTYGLVGRKMHLHNVETGEWLIMNVEGINWRSLGVPDGEIVEIMRDEFFEATGLRGRIAYLEDRWRLTFLRWIWGIFAPKTEPKGICRPIEIGIITNDAERD